MSQDNSDWNDRVRAAQAFFQAQEESETSRALDAIANTRLASVRIHYYRPDHPDLLQEFLWQTEDQAPRFPRIGRFLKYWRENIEATIKTIELSHTDAPQAAKYRTAQFMKELN